MTTLKRDDNGSIYFELTDRYTVLGHPMVSETNESILYLPYRVVKVFTQTGLSINALKYLKGNGVFENYTLDNHEKKIFHSREPLNYENIPEIKDFSHNCYGKSFCDGQFWFDFDSSLEEQIVNSENLSSSRDENDISQNCIILLYQNGVRIHGIKVDENYKFLSKDGTNALKIYSSWEEFKQETTYSFDTLRVLKTI